MTSRFLRHSYAWSWRKITSTFPMRLVLTAGLLLVLSLASPAQESDDTFKVDVKLVNVFVTVTDERGAPIAGLKKDNFQLSEDGKEQKIAVFDKESALPLSIVLAIDTSLSTRKDLPLELASARRFVHAILRPVDALSLYQFSETVSELTSFTSDLHAVDRGIDHIRLGSATALYDALFLGSQALEPRQGRKVMVVITDGGDTMSKVDYHEAVREAETAEAILYSIIIVPIEASAGRDTGGEHALIQLSLDTGGKHFYASSCLSWTKLFARSATSCAPSTCLRTILRSALPILISGASR